jgi:hypothetical protein
VVGWQRQRIACCRGGDSSAGRAQAAEQAGSNDRKSRQGSRSSFGTMPSKERNAGWSRVAVIAVVVNPSAALGARGVAVVCFENRGELSAQRRDAGQSRVARTAVGELADVGGGRANSGGATGHRAVRPKRVVDRDEGGKPEITSASQSQGGREGVGWGRRRRDPARWRRCDGEGDDEGCRAEKCGSGEGWVDGLGGPLRVPAAPCWPGCPVGLVQSRAWRTAFVSLSGYRTVLMGIDGIDPIVSAKDSSLGIPDGHLLSPFAHSAIPTAGAARKSRSAVHQMESPFSAIHPGTGTGHQNITNHKPAVQVCLPCVRRPRS